MLQLFLIGAGIVAIVMGIYGFGSGEIELTGTTKLEGTSAKVAGALTFLLGVALLVFAFLGIPLILGN